MIYLLIWLCQSSFFFFTPPGPDHHYGQEQENTFSSATIVQDTSSQENLTQLKAEEKVYELSLWWYRQGTPLMFRLFNEQTNKLLSQREIMVPRKNKRVQIPLEEYLAKGISSFRIVVTNKKKQRNRIYYFSR